ncbi:protein LNK1 isoform X2 [Neltuma alba]|uniref:protein LNK1 isoform X2 n=1 Tax=Neltuma alba TaxID=207710 RepID=UPI0010A30394|nr:protein LNK1-like isoform X2 [Prosopis alba]XP_028753165.1 protein LNK1-like isoform X2 [Prosopis alba]
MIEDNVWDGFGENDHIVALSGDEHTDQFAIEADGSKKQRLEFHGTRSTDLSTYDAHGQKEFYSPTITQEEIMLEEGSWSHQSEGVFPSRDSEACKEVKRPSSDDTRMSGHHYKSSNIDSIDSELCMDDTVLGDKCVVEDDSVCEYPINHISEADNELSFLDNDGWLDIGNFEDVDRMFRSCDSTFGMGSLNNEEEFCWLSSSNGTDGSDDVSKCTFKLSGAEPSLLKNTSDNDTDSKAGTGGLSINDSNKKASSFNKKSRTRMDVDDSVPASSSVLSESDIKSGGIDDSMPKEKRKLSKPSEGRRKSEYLENGNAVYPCAPLKQYGDVKETFGASSGKVSSQVSIQKRKPNNDSDSLGCLQTHVNRPHPGYTDFSSNTALLPAPSGSRSEHNSLPSPSLIESSYASNVESSQAHSLEAAALIANEKRERLYHPNAAQPLTKSFKIENMAGSLPCQSPVSAQQLVHQFENENEGHSEVDGVSVGFSQETESSNVQEISSMSSVDEISLEASFRQLQLVMDQLDIRTKLCIRDSLYRLARSAEQRHNYAKGNGSIGENIEACKAMMTQDVSGCSGFVDMETDTNPIDRSIAHFLFHRPTDSSVMPPSEK